MQFDLAVDIGGTFTDVVLQLADERTAIKVLTTHVDPADGVLQGIDEVLDQTGLRAADARVVLHGTTLATNALIERRGAVTALLTTEGHRDALEMALENRFDQYDVNIDRPTPLVPRHLRLPVVERMDAQGIALLELDESSVIAQLDTLREYEVTSIAIGFLHAYVNDVHEQRVAELVRSHLPDVSISLSSTVCPEIREYERLSTTCANAYVKPMMAGYLSSLERKLGARGFVCPILLMTSSGGLTTLRTAREFPIRLVESGPAGGAILASQLAAEGGFTETLSFDMGGTTAKLCIIDEGTPLVSRAFEVDRSYRFRKGSGLPIRIPVIEMVEIGAGGGSIAQYDELGRIQVGPESAGSEPGPACYARGGNRPTVTDADVVLGKLVPEHFAGGKLTLDPLKARASLRSVIGEPMNLSDVLSAHAVSEVVNENMAAAARAHLAEWGKGTTSRVLIAFGGAAPLHACLLAHKLKLDQVLIPKDAGVGSAVGFLKAPVSFEVVRSHYMRLAQLDLAVVHDLMQQMSVEAAAVVGELVDAREMVVVRKAFMRYVGQGYEIAVALDDTTDMENLLPQVLRQKFESAYLGLYGRTIPNLEIEILSWTLQLGEAVGKLDVHDEVVRERPVKPHTTREIFDVVVARTLDADCFFLQALQPGDYLSGPALVIDNQTTVFVASGFDACVSKLGNLLLTR